MHRFKSCGQNKIDSEILANSIVFLPELSQKRLFLDAIASQEIPYIQVTYLLTHLLTELKSPSRSGLQAFQTSQSYQ